jgi:hypothetical protein
MSTCQSPSGMILIIPSGYSCSLKVGNGPHGYTDNHISRPLSRGRFPDWVEFFPFWELFRWGRKSTLDAGARAW